MQQYYKLMRNSPLFSNISPDDYPALLGCVQAKTAQYHKDEFISLSGDAVNHIGMVLQGGVLVLKEDVFGNRAILNNLGPGAIFGESFLCGGNDALTVSVQAAETAEVLFLSFDKVMQSCSNACAFHSILLKNMVVMIAQKNVRLVEKLEVTTKHSLREKILAYLSQLAQQQQTATVQAPLGRVDLADFMGVDRSALTRELNRMRQQGLLEYERNTYRLLGLPAGSGLV